jgi:hypothetical protein
MGELWVALVVAAFVLLLLLIFILQNGQRAQVSFLGAHGSLPMGVALLLATVFCASCNCGPWADVGPLSRPRPAHQPPTARPTRR